MEVKGEDYAISVYSTIATFYPLLISIVVDSYSALYIVFKEDILILSTFYSNKG